jgi:DNA-binding transcriptional ArsR family regulator
MDQEEKPLDLASSDPQVLLAHASLDALLEAAERVEIWSRREASALDYVYRNLVIRALRLPRPQEDLENLAEHLRRVVPHSARDAVERLGQFLTRWHLLADLVETRLEQLASSDVAAVLRRDHSQRILEVLRGESLPQSKLADRLGLKPANLSRILGLLEANDLIYRMREGRENIVGLGPVPDPAPVIPDRFNPDDFARETPLDGENAELKSILNDDLVKRIERALHAIGETRPEDSWRQRADLARLHGRRAPESTCRRIANELRHHAQVEIDRTEDWFALAADPAFWQPECFEIRRRDGQTVVVVQTIRLMQCVAADRDREDGLGQVTQHLPKPAGVRVRT